MSNNEEKYLKAFGAVLKSLRKSIPMSQESLAFESGLHVTFISRLETGNRQPTLSTLFKLSNALGIEVEELVARVAQELKNQV